MRYVIIVLALMILVSCSRTPQPVTNEPIQPAKEVQEQTEPVISWRYGNLAVAGKYADADIVDIGNGKYRLYYSAEPEISDFKGQVYSAVSSDGINWNQESGERMEWATFPSIIKLPDGRYRMYFQNQGAIKSAVSSDGLSWNQEPGTRMDKSNNAGLNLENAAAPTVIKSGDNYIMVYRGTINEKYPAQVPNSNIQMFLWAVSKDGLNFDKKGIALDSRNEMFYGLLDGPEFTEWDDEAIRLYFWSYRGVYHVTFTDEKFSTPEFDYTTDNNPRNLFPENPPGDPTLAKINGKWMMYYGQHTKGIYYAVLE